MNETLEAVLSNPTIAFVVGALVVLLIVSSRRSGIRNLDPQRIFTAEQRAAGFDRADGRCEFSGLLFRCRGAAEHGDHYFPWSKGGASSMGNFVAGCAPCNLSKGAKPPSRLNQIKLERRRRRYFPPGVDVRAGAWYGSAR